MKLSRSTCVMFLLLIASLLAGCGTPAATSTPIPVVERLTPFLPTATLTPLPPTATLTPLPPTATLTPVLPTATRTPLPPTDAPSPTAAATGVAVSSQDRVLSPEVSRGDLTDLVAGNNAFAFDLYQALRDGQDNLLYSPYSISAAMAMVYAGARGRTEQQMAETMHYDLPQGRLHPAFNALGLELDNCSYVATWDASGERVEKVAFQLNTANAVWGQAGYPFWPEYLDLLARNYGAGVRLVDFRTNAPAAVDAINQWVSEETEGLIREVVDELSEETALVLANAIYFNAIWDSPFREANTEDGPFYLLDGDEVKVPLMQQRDDFRYTEGDGYQAIQLLFIMGDAAMEIVLPAEGRFRELEERLAGDWVQSVVGGFSRREVILTMPKFSFETPVLDLVETLAAMGMPDAFSLLHADFSGITESPLYISDVLHKAFIDVDERGTEAAAATIVVGPPGMPPTEPAPVIMKIDRPFIFLIRDLKTNAILFVGRVMNPTSE